MKKTPNCAILSAPTLSLLAGAYIEQIEPNLVNLIVDWGSGNIKQNKIRMRRVDP